MNWDAFEWHSRSMPDESPGLLGGGGALDAQEESVVCAPTVHNDADELASGRLDFQPQSRGEPFGNVDAEAVSRSVFKGCENAARGARFVLPGCLYADHDGCSR